jgi:hypothetical protein
VIGSTIGQLVDQLEDLEHPVTTKTTTILNVSPRSGIVMRNNCWVGVAPSIALASYTSEG